MASYMTQLIFCPLPTKKMFSAHCDLKIRRLDGYSYHNYLPRDSSDDETICRFGAETVSTLQRNIVHIANQRVQPDVGWRQ